MLFSDAVFNIFAGVFDVLNTPNANIADHSAVAWNEHYESEASWASVFFLTSFLRRVLLHSRSRLVYFAMSTNIPPKGSEIFHRKESFFSFPVRL